MLNWINSKIKWIDSLKNKVFWAEKIVNETSEWLKEISTLLEDLVWIVNIIDKNLSSEMKDITKLILTKITLLDRNNNFHKMEIWKAKKELEKWLSLIKSFYEKTTKDQLTWLWNGEYINNLIDVLWEQKKEFTFIFIDLNDLKKINDTYGHIAWDNIIKWFSKFLQEIFWIEKNYVARLHGDEFNVVSFDSYDILKKKIDLLNKWTENKKINIITEDWEDIRVSFDFWLWVAKLSEVSTIPELIHLADKRMYKDKFKKKSK